jgi:eukaryotic-like serine/threonine-protein kinase
MNREETIFEQALGLGSPAERERFVREACSGNELLLRSVQGLLRVHDRAGKFIDPQAANTPEGPTPSSAGLLGRVTGADTEAPGDRIGRYKLLEKIGEGGCGVVYMAEQEEPVRRRVALKVIKIGMDTEAVVARFEAERQALAMMDHPSIAKVLEAGATESGRPYFVMELVRGAKITEFCDRNNLPTAGRLDLFMQVCRAIQHAHQKGIIHRDIKPSNILVTLHDGVPVPKVIDFGIAKATQGRLTDKTIFTSFHQFLGTPAYMSPEQAEMSGLDIDTRSDIYSLGVLLYELLTGKTPFDSKQLLEAGLDAMRRTIREQEPARPSTKLSTMVEGELTITADRRQTEAPKLVHAVRGDLDWIVMKALEKDRGRRYETANGLATDLQRHLDNEPVMARPPSNLYRFQKMVCRNKLAFAAAGAVTLALLTGLGAATWEFAKEREARQRAVAAEREQGRLRHQAETEAAKSQRVAEFLKDMLKGVNPSAALGRDTTMLREILDKTAARLDQSLTNEPEVELELRGVIAETYRDLGMFKQMEKMASASLQVARSRLGEQSKPVAESLHWLSQAENGLGKVKQAEESARDALALSKRLRVHDSKLVAVCLNDLGLLLWQRSSLADAEAMLGQALALERQLSPKDDDSGTAALNDLALVLRDEGKFKESEQVFREALALSRKVSGAESPSVMLKLCNLALVVGDQGRLAEAEELHREALRQARKLLGGEHKDVAWTAANLASNLRKQGKFAEAESLQREALALRRKLLGNEHPDVANSLNSLAVLLGDQNRPAEAIPLYREALELRRKVYGQEHAAVANSLVNLAVALERCGNPTEAEPLCREGMVLARKFLRVDHPDLTASMDELGKILLETGRPAEAEQSIRESLAIREKSAPDQIGTFVSRSLLGAALLGQRNYGEAEPLLLSGYEGVKQREAKLLGAQKQRLREALQRLVLLYEQTGNSERGAEWKQKLAEFDGINTVRH